MSLLDLYNTQTLCIHEFMKVVMVDKAEDLIPIDFSVIAPSLKGFNNSKELPIVCFLLGLNWNYFSGKKGYRMPLTNFGSAKI